MTAQPPAPVESEPAAPPRAPRAGALASAVPASIRGLSWRVVPVLALALAAGLLLVRAVYILAEPVALLVLAIAIAEALAPVVRPLERVIGRGPAAIVVYLALLVLIVLLGWYAVPRLIAQVTSLVAHAPEALAATRRLLAPWDAQLGGRLAALLGEQVAKLSAIVLGLPRKLFTAAATVLLVIFLSFYWLVTQPALERFFLSLFPPRRRPGTDSVLTEMGHAMGGYVRGVAINAAITGALAGLGLLIVGFDFPLLAVLLTAIGELVPILGVTLVGIFVAAIALLQSPGYALLVIGVYSVVINVEGHVLTPNIMRRQTQVPQTLVLFALVAGAGLGGLLGALVAIPIAAALRVFVLSIVAPAVRRYTGAVVIAPGAEP